jgi:hypothetical protein
MDASTTIVEESASGRISGGWQPGTRAWVVALVLWLASNILTTGIARMASWQGNTAYAGIADFCKWDCEWYGSIIHEGYWHTPSPDTVYSNWVFNPLFPMTAFPLHKWFRLSLPGSLVAASKLELLLAIYAFMLMFGDELQSKAEFFRAGSLVAFNPYVIYAHAGYAEPLYFAFIALAFYFASRRRWILTGTASALASASRAVGVVFAASYVVSWLRTNSRRNRRRKLDLNAIIGLLLCPLGTALFMLYLYHHLGDALALQHGHVAWGRHLQNPLLALWLCLAQPHWPRVWGAMMIAAWLLCAWLFKLRKPEFGVYLAFALLLATLSPMSGYWGVARYIWWQPPFLYAIYRLLRRNEAAWLVYLVFASGMATFMTMGWFSGNNFVV